jgi:Protein of unknown function (DUF2735)
MPIGAQPFGTAKKCAAAAQFAGYDRAAMAFLSNCAAVSRVLNETPPANIEGANQTRKNRNARIVGICCFLGVRGAQTACNSRRKDYLAPQRNLIVSRTMTTSTPQESANQASAKIYQFPVGGRRAVEANREPTPTVNTFGSWYHEAAIQEAVTESRREH